MHNPQKLTSLIRKRSSELGFDLCGIAKARELKEQRRHLLNWISEGRHATMYYMNRNLEKRTDPSSLVSNAKSVIVVGYNYFMEENRNPDTPRFSRYAWGDDYHKVVKDKLYSLREFITSMLSDVDGRVFVDSAPVLEKAWAVESGLGWIGKNSLLINREKGSFLFLGELILNIELDYDNPFEKDYCGSCTKCIDACPTNAILMTRTIDSGRCISYLTIEHKGQFDPDARHLSLNGYLFGCDICQDVCPWNSKAETTQEPAFAKLPEIEEFTTEEWKKITEDQFNIIFRNSPVLRTGYNSFMRNLQKL